MTRSTKTNNPATEIHSSRTRLVLACLILIVATGALLRVAYLSSDSIWLDEAYSIHVAHENISGIIDEASSDVHPPLYYFLLHYWINFFGDSEESARLLSALFGIICIPLAYKLAALLFDRPTGILSALFMAFSHFNIDFSQETRMYSLLVMLTLASLYFFLKLFEARSNWMMMGYVLTSILLMHTHVYGLFVIAAENIFFLTLYFSSRELFKRVFKRWILAQSILFLLFVPWLTVLTRQVLRVRKGFWIPRPTWNEFRLTWITIAGSYKLTWLLVPLAAIPVILLLKRVSRASAPFINNSENQSNASLPFTNRQKILFLLIWLAGVILLPFVVSHFVTPIFLLKYTIPASPAFLILAARGVMSLRPLPVRTLLVVAFLIFALTDMRDYYRAIKKDVWRDSVAFFNKKAQRGDLVLFTEPAAHMPFDYYARRTDITEKPFPDYNNQLGRYDELRSDNVAELLKPVIEGHNRVWVVLSHQNELSPLVPAQMSEWYIIAEHRIDPGVEIYLFEKK